MLKIKFNTEDLDKDEARGIVALLVGIYGPDIAPSSRVSVTNTINATRAPDGYPVTETSGEGQTEPDDKEVSPPMIGIAGDFVERDKDGIPWDERIHASTKTKNKDGTWTRRRNTPDEAFDAVMTELKAANTARTLQAAAGMVPAPPTSEPEPTAAAAFAPTTPAVPTPPTAAVVPTPPPPAASASATFVAIMQKITAAQQAGKLDKPGLDALLLQCGIDGGVAKLVTADEGTRAAVSALVDALA